MHVLLKPILQHPEAPSILAALQNSLADEAQRRHAFREWIDENQKAEFINGEIVLHSPTEFQHWKLSALLSSLLNIYSSSKQLGTVGVEKVMISLTRNDYEPDICFFSNENSANFTDDQMLFPAPDFVVEILSKRTAKNDRSIKKQDYALHGIREYWIIDANKQIVEQYLLVEDHAKEYFLPNIYNINDDIESRVIKGFVIPVLAIFDEKANVAALQTLLK